MSKTPSQQGDLSEEFRKLGSNLKEAVHAAWNSPDRQRLEGEIRTGLEHVTEALGDLAKEAAKSEAGQRFRSDLEHLEDRVKSGELEAKIRSDMLSALQNLNEELERARRRWNREQGEHGTNRGGEPNRHP